MVLHNACLEKFLKPVGISLFCSLHIGQTSFRSIGYCEIPIIIQYIMKFIHSCYQSFSFPNRSKVWSKMPTSYKLLYDGHLVLRVHNVVFAISRDKAESRFVSIGNATGTGCTFLGYYLHNPCNSTRPIDSCG